MEGTGASSGERRIPLFTLRRETVKPLTLTGYIIAAVILPCICFFMVERAPGPPPTFIRQGDILNSLNLLLTARAVRPFYALIAYSVICLLVYAIKPGPYAGKDFIRMGLYGGSILSLQYTLLVTVMLNGIPIVVGVAYGIGYFMLINAFRKPVMWPLIIIILLASLLVLVFAFQSLNDPFSALAILIIAFSAGMIISAPILAFIAFATALMDIQSRDENQKASIQWGWMVPVLWIGGYATAWCVVFL